MYEFEYLYGWITLAVALIALQLFLILWMRRKVKKSMDTKDIVVGSANFWKNHFLKKIETIKQNNSENSRSSVRSDQEIQKRFEEKLKRLKRIAEEKKKRDLLERDSLENRTSQGSDSRDTLRFRHTAEEPLEEGASLENVLEK